MSLRITAILLAVLSPLGLSAADDDSDLFFPAAEPHIDVLVPSVDLLNGIDLDGVVFQLGTDGYLSGGSTNFGIRLANPEFPFSPRLVRRLNDVQFNYGTGIRDAAQNLGEFDNPPAVLRYGSILDVDALLPLIIPVAATVSDAAPTVQQADAESCTAACGRSLNPADCPIDVVMADDEADADCGEPSPFHPVPVVQDTLMHQLFAGFNGLETLNVTTTSETCSHAEPPLKAKVEHLLEAARHLAGAGYEEEAKLFRVEAEAIQKASTRLLTEKRQELERLQREITELEELTGQYTMIQLNCQILEVTLPDGCAADPQLSLLTKSGYCVLGSRAATDPCRPAAGGESNNVLTSLLESLRDHACIKLKTIAEPTLITMNGHSAQLHNGGEFPILIPVSAGGSKPAQTDARIEWRDFGVKLQAVPFVLGNGKLRLSLDAEVSERDYGNAMQVAGGVIPGLTTRRSRTDVETHFGDTVVIRCCTSAVKDGEKTLLMLVTAHQVEPLPEPHHHD